MKSFNDFTLKSLFNLHFVAVQHVPDGSLEVKLSLILLCNPVLKSQKGS